MGGFCPKVRVWWYFEWPESIRCRTLKYVKNKQSGLLIDINVLEYAMFLITCHRINQMKLLETVPHPQVLMRGDNTTSESWSKKVSKHSPVGRALGRLQCALMLNNPIALQSNHIPTELNVVADKISRVDSETNQAATIPRIQKEHPELTGCHRFNQQLANLMPLGNHLKHRVQQSNRTKQAGTNKSRKNHFLGRCKTMGIPDGGTALRDIQAANFLLACYAISLIHEETIKNIWIRYTTRKGYLARAIECWTDRNKASPRLEGTDYVHLHLEAVRKYEKVPNHREMITDNMIGLYKQYQLTTPDSLVVALFEWISFGRYTGFRSIEWCHDNTDTYSRITDPAQTQRLLSWTTSFSSQRRANGYTSKQERPFTQPNQSHGASHTLKSQSGSKRTTRITKS